MSEKYDKASFVELFDSKTNSDIVWKWIEEAKKQELDRGVKEGQGDLDVNSLRKTLIDLMNWLELNINSDGITESEIDQFLQDKTKT